MPETDAETVAEYRPREIAAEIQAHSVENCCVLYSGDSGFYSGAAGLLPLLENMEVRVLPGISSLQSFSAGWGSIGRIGTSARPMGWPVIPFRR